MVFVVTSEALQRFRWVALSSDELQAQNIGDNIPRKPSQEDKFYRRVARAYCPKLCLDDTRQDPLQCGPLDHFASY